MKTHGTIEWGEFEIGNGARRRRRKAWRIRAEPYVFMRLKRLFARIDKGDHGELFLADTPEVCRELQWFIARFPLQISFVDIPRLEAGALAHQEREEMVANVLSGTYRPAEFDLVYPPREYQRIAAEMLLRSRSLLLGDDLGLGKTVSAIATFTDPRTLPAVVVTLTHLPKQWEREINRFAPNLRVHIAKKGTAYDVRAKHRGQFPDVFIINYHKLSGWADALAPVIKSIVFDECQELRSGGETEKYKAAKFLSEAASFRLGMSATPIYNYGEEMFYVLDVLAPESLGTHEEFLREWCRPEGNHHLIKDSKTFGNYLRDQGLMLRRTRADVGRELPSLTRVPHHVDSDEREINKVADAAAELARIILAQTEDHRGQKLQAAQEISWKLRQATGIAKAPYVANFVRMLVETGEKVVLYGWHREVYALWMAMLRDLDPVLYTGSESATQKQAALEQFTKGGSRVLIMSLRAGAGVDGLQHHARTVVFGELDWSPGVHEQCMGRLHRDGQAHQVVAYFLIADHGSDPVIADVLGVKREQVEVIRDPNAELVEHLQVDPDHIKKLAAQFLQQRGKAA